MIAATLACVNGCSRAPQGSGSVQSTRRPLEVRSSADVVRLEGSGMAMSQPGAGEVLIVFTVDENYHVNANPATYPYLIATEITTDKVDGLQVEKPIYPAAEKKKFEFAEEPLAVYEGRVQITLTFTATQKGKISLPYHLRVQACDTEKCFPPATIDGTTSIDEQ
jgi:hypothetical protein